MKEKMNKKLVILLVSVFMLGSLLAPTGIAANVNQSVKGVFSDVITIFSNNQKVNLGSDPNTGKAYKPIVTNDNRVYVPVRAISEMLGKDVSWDGPNNRINIADKYDPNYYNMLKELTDSKKKISDLEAKVKQLESELESKNKISNLSDLEKLLNKEHDLYKSVGFDIDLTGSTKDIKVNIYVDSRDNSSWKAMTKTQIETYVENVVADIQESFKDAKISGYIINEYNNKKEVEFYFNSRNKLVVDTNYSGGSGSKNDLYDLEKDLNWYYRSYKGIDFEIVLSWNKNDIMVEIYVDGIEWEGLSTKNKESYLESLYNEISYEFPYDYVFGYIYDDYYSYKYDIGYFEFDSWGYVDLK